MEQDTWVIERDDNGRWNVNGAPDHANASSLGFALEIAAEEAKRLGFDGVVEVHNGDTVSRTPVDLVIEDYGLEDTA